MNCIQTKVIGYQEKKLQIGLFRAMDVRSNQNPVKATILKENNLHLYQPMIH